MLCSFVPQAVSEGSGQNQHPPSQVDPNFVRSDVKYDYDMSVNGQNIHSGYLDVHISQGEPDSVIPSSTREAKVFSHKDVFIFQQMANFDVLLTRR